MKSLGGEMERIVDRANMQQAWRIVKANRGAPGADGITLEQFAETFATSWPSVRQQLLEGTYRPGAARQWLAVQGLFSLLQRWSELASKRRTA